MINLTKLYNNNLLKGNRKSKGNAGELLVKNSIKCQRCGNLDYYKFNNSNFPCVDLFCNNCKQYYQIKVITKNTKKPSSNVTVIGGSYNKILQCQYNIDYIVIIIDSQLFVQEILYKPFEKIDKKNDIKQFVLGNNHKQKGYVMCNIKLLNCVSIYHCLITSNIISVPDVNINNITTPVSNIVSVPNVNINNIKKETNKQKLLTFIKNNLSNQEFKSVDIYDFAKKNFGGKTQQNSACHYLQILRDEGLLLHLSKNKWKLI